MLASPDSTGQACSATKQTWGLRAGARATGATGASVATLRSSSDGAAIGADIPRIDTFQFPCDIFDAGVRAHPAFLFRGDRRTLRVGLEDGVGKPLRRAA